MLVVPLVTTLTNGWVSTPYDPLWAARHPRRAATMAAAGPAANLLITLVAFAAVKVGLRTGVFVSPDHASFHHLVEATNGAGWLDGASAIGGILPERAALAVRGFLSSPVFSLLGIFVAWQVFPYFVDPFFGALLKVVHPADVYE